MACNEHGAAGDENDVSEPLRRPRILLGVTGSVAAVKGPEMAVRLARELHADVSIVLTRGGSNFWTKAEGYDNLNWQSCNNLVNESLSSKDIHSSDREEVVLLYSPDDEWKKWDRLGDSVLHIDLRNWADIMLIAPLSAHSLAKFATGLCDDTLSCCVRAWDFGHGSRPGKPIILAPAMNTAMWNHPLTRSQLVTMQQFWNERVSPNCVHVVEPLEKMLACGEIGEGALADVSDILDRVRLSLGGISIRQEEVAILATTNCETSQESTRGERLRRALVSLAKERFKDQEQKVLEQPGNTTNTSQKLVAPVSPTPPGIISDVLPRLRLNKDSILIDLGCGDGRWLVSAVKMYQCRCLGYDIDEERLQMARNELDRYNLGDHAELLQKDVFEVMESPVFLNADVIIVYLFREAMQKMNSILANSKVEKSMRILCIGFALPSRVPEWTQTYARIPVYLYHLLAPISPDR